MKIFMLIANSWASAAIMGLLHSAVQYWAVQYIALQCSVWKFLSRSNIKIISLLIINRPNVAVFLLFFISINFVVTSCYFSRYGICSTIRTRQEIQFLLFRRVCGCDCCVGKERMYCEKLGKRVRKCLHLDTKEEWG